MAQGVRVLFILILTCWRAPVSAATCDPVPSGIVAWWAAEGNANDSVGMNNGVLEGGANYASGEVGQAFSLDGTSGYVFVPASSGLNVGLGQGLTIEGWIETPTMTAAQIIVEWQNMTTYADGPHMQTGTGSGGNLSTGALYANIMDTGSGSHMIWSSPNVLVANQFQHVALTYDQASGVGTLYVNGSVVAQSNLGTFTPQTSFDFYLGTRLGGSLDFEGQLDEISVYDRALASSEIAAIYRAGSVGKCTTPEPPVITVPPANETQSVGATAVFSVAAAGTAPLAYQWDFNGAKIAGATNTTLTLTNVQPSQAGDYFVSITNRYGFTNSAEAVLTVNAEVACDPVPPGIVGWWPGEGNAVDASGQGNNGLLDGPLGFAPGEVGQAFSYPPVNNGNYSAVRIPPSTSLNVGFGSGFTIEAWIKPNDVVSYGPVFEWNNGTNWGGHLYTGAITHTPGPGSLYADVMDNTQTSHLFWSAAGVIVADVFQHVALTYDQASGVATLYCNGLVVGQETFGSFTPETSFDLYVGHRPLTHTEEYSYPGLIDEAAVYNRALSSAEIAAIYQAGSAGKCTTPEPPVITLQPASQTRQIGTTATFTVTVAGTAPLAYQWAFDGTKIAGATNAALSLTNVQFPQSGDYSVSITNLYGSTNSADALLTVSESPTCTPAPAGIVGWWPGDDNTVDLIGGNNGTLVGAVSYGPAEVGQGFVLDGWQEMVTVGNPTSLQLQDFTIEAWIKRASSSGVHVGGGNGVIFGYGAGGYALYLDQNGTPAVTQIPAGHSQPAVSITDTNFHHLAVTKSGSTIVFYVDGAAYPAPAFDPTFTFSTVAAIGGRADTLDNSFLGMIDEVSVYNGALSSNEIADIYQSGSAGKCVTPVPPVISSQPAAQTALEGGSAAFAVQVGGTGPIKYQWTFNGRNLAGATSAVLTLTNLHPAQAGSYAVKVSSPYGSTTSASAQLTVLRQDILVYRYAGSETIVTAGQDLTFPYEGVMFYLPDNTNGTYVGCATIKGQKTYWVNSISQKLLITIPGVSGQSYTLLGDAGAGYDGNGVANLHCNLLKGWNTRLAIGLGKTVLFPGSFAGENTHAFPDAQTGLMKLDQATSSFSFDPNATQTANNTGETLTDLVSHEVNALKQSGYQLQ